MTLLDALRHVYDGSAYGARPSSWVRNGDVYVFSDGHWRLEFNDAHSQKAYGWPSPEILFSDWDVVSRDKVTEERKVHKLL